jgi:hypothetical protein
MKSKLSAALAAVMLAFALLGATAAANADVIFYDTQAAFSAASNTNLLDNFSLPAGTGQFGGHGTTSITRNGVTYTDVSGTNDILILAPGDYWNFGAAVGITTDYVVTTDYDEHILATFSTTYTAVGFTAYFNGSGREPSLFLVPAGAQLGRLISRQAVLIPLLVLPTGGLLVLRAQYPSRALNGTQQTAVV